jgi:uncharacterized membrane protein
MIQSVEPLDRLVEDYLAAVAAACAGLPAVRREELIRDLREHITVARSGLREPTEADIRAILDRLGEPDAIASEARVGEPALPVAPLEAVPHRPGRWRTVAIVVGSVMLALLLLAVILVGAFVFIAV